MSPQVDGATPAGTGTAPMLQASSPEQEPQALRVPDCRRNGGESHARVSVVRTANVIAGLLRITLAVALIAILAAFGRWLTPRFGLLPTVDQTMAVLACVALALVALALVIRTGGRR